MIKADLQRHLAGNYEPNFPEDKKVVTGNIFTTGADTTQYGKHDPKSIWRDLEDKKNGIKRSGE